MQESGLFRYLHHLIPLLPPIFILILICLPLPWSEVHTPEGGKIMGAISYEMDASLTPWKAEYNVTARVGEGGLLGGLGGGNNITVEGERYYLTAGGEALEDIGLIYDSYRVKEGRIRIKAREGFVNLTLRIEAEMIPFYREGSEVPFRVSVRVDDARVDFSRIAVEKVKIILKSEWDEGSLSYLRNTTLSYDPGGENTIESPDEKLAWNFRVKMPEGAGRVGVTALLDLTFEDSRGMEEDYILTSAPNPINLYPVTTSQFVRLGGLAAAGPEGVIGALMAISAPFIRKRKRLSRGLEVSGAIILLISPVHFLTSVGVVGDLLAMRITGAEDMITLNIFPYAVLALSVSYILLLLLKISGILRFTPGQTETEKEKAARRKEAKEEGEKTPGEGEQPSEGVFRRVD